MGRQILFHEKTPIGRQNRLNITWLNPDLTPSFFLFRYPWLSFSIFPSASSLTGPKNYLYEHDPLLDAGTFFFNYPPLGATICISFKNPWLGATTFSIKIGTQKFSIWRPIFQRPKDHRFADWNMKTKDTALGSQNVSIKIPTRIIILKDPRLDTRHFKPKDPYLRCILC